MATSDSVATTISPLYLPVSSWLLLEGAVHSDFAGQYRSLPHLGQAGDGRGAISRQQRLCRRRAKNRSLAAQFGAAGNGSPQRQRRRSAQLARDRRHRSCVGQARELCQHVVFDQRQQFIDAHRGHADPVGNRRHGG